MQRTSSSTNVKARTPFWKVRLNLALKNFLSNWKLFTRNPIGVIGLVIIIIFALMAIAHPILMRYVWEPRVYDPIIGYDFTIFQHPSPPSVRHLLGTDPLGRDILSQLLYGTRFSFVLGISSALISVIIATLIGAISAYYGGLIDMIFMRLADVLLSFPTLVLGLIILALLGPGLWKMISGIKHLDRLPILLQETL